MRTPATLDEREISEPVSERATGGLALTEDLSLRVSPHGYFAAIYVGSFISALFFYLEFDRVAIAAFIVSWVVVPFLAFRDRITFDGKRLVRTGYLPQLWSWLTVARRRLKISDIEQVETHAIRVLRRGGNIYYRYRTVFRGKGVSVSIASGGDEFRNMVRSILVQLPENALDTRSIELRDHLVDPKEALMRAEFARIPDADVLESLLTPISRGRAAEMTRPSTIADDAEAEDLRSLGNELRLAGYLLQALEAFRRALVIKPRDSRLLFDFARCLYAYAGVRRDKEMEHRSLAAIRLSEMRGREDLDLTTRLGEWYFQIGEWKRAAAAFQRVIDRAGANFRTALGLAEIALREGKIAHVIHNFASAGSTAQTPSLRRWSRNESAYFSNLNSDDEYMELEVGRINMLGTLDSSRKTALRIAIFALPLIATGLVFEDQLVTNIGWAVSSFALLMWIVLIISYRLMSQRIPYEFIEGDE